MNTFSEFYLTEQDVSVPLSIDFRNDVHSEKELNGSEYKQIKDYLNDMTDSSGKTQITVNDKSFSILKRFYSDESHSDMSNTSYMNHSIQKILEISKYETSYGVIIMCIVQGGINKYFYLQSDKAFVKKSNLNMTDVYNTIKKILDKENESNALEKQAEEDKKIELQNIEAEKEKNKTLDASNKEKEQKIKKTKEEQDKIDAEVKKLGNKSIHNGRFGYYDITSDEYNELVSTLQKDKNIVGDKTGYAWFTKNKTARGKLFGEGLLFNIRGSNKKKKPSTIYMFKYNYKLMPDSAMIIFDGVQSFNDFLEIQIPIKAFGGKGKFGRNEKIQLYDTKECFWINTPPQEIEPPMNQNNIDEFEKIKKQNPTVKKESTWFETAMLET